LNVSKVASISPTGSAATGQQPSLTGIRSAVDQITHRGSRATDRDFNSGTA
jgi:hypothetical protein